MVVNFQIGNLVKSIQCEKCHQIQSMDAESLQLFVSVCKAGSLIKVASRMHVSPSSITKRIQKLEKDFGTTLIQRVHRGVEPTMAGQLLLEKSMNLLRQMDEMRQMMGMYGDLNSGVVTLMGSYSMTAAKLVDDVTRFLLLNENKNVCVHVHEGDKQSIVDALRDGRVSLGVLWTATETAGLELYPYYEDRAAVVVCKTHPLALRDEVAYKDLIEYETVRTKTTRKMELMLERVGSIDVLTQHNRAEVPGFEALLRMVQKSHFVGLCPMEVAEQYADVFQIKAIKLSDAWASRTHVIACQNSEILSPAGRALLNYLRAQHDLTKGFGKS